ncbi:MAG: family 78 glycoside hydrolase catalytic domain [Cytophagales bacterium]|nr:family 78 glycoside hydrolase catalytic domain [Cytophagales bacterium]
MKKYILALIISVTYFCSLAQPSTSSLKCEYLDNPEGIDRTTPRLSWLMTSGSRNVMQTAYQIVAVSTLENINASKYDLWDSGKINASQSLNIAYAGKPLTSEATVYWRVKIWDNKGNESAWSTVAGFSMGLLNTTDWKALWIGNDGAMANDKPFEKYPLVNARYFRNEFNISKPIKTAKIYLIGLGMYELSINGKKVSDWVFAPAQTQFDVTVLYNTFDITSQLKQGANAIGCILGNGRWGNLRSEMEWAQIDKNNKFPKLLCQINITYTDGSKQTVASDASWKMTAEGPTGYNNEFDGENYDANKELTGWDMPNYNHPKFTPVQIVPAPLGKIQAQMNEPMKVIETLNPISINEPKPATYIYDMGQNMVGWVAISLQAAKGTTVKLRFAETLQSDGTLYMANLRSAQVTDTYICKGAGIEQWEPKFTYHGFRYVEVTGLPSKPGLDFILGKVVHDDVKVTGTFECSNDILNKIHRNAYWGIKGNYRSFPTDCPQRDERQGWLGDRGASSRGEMYLFNNITLYAKWMQDVSDSQTPDGQLPDVSPTFFKIYNDDVTWPSAAMIIPTSLYEIFGSKYTIEKNYPMMKKWMTRMEGFFANGLISKDSYGDWCVPPEDLSIIWSKEERRKTPTILLASSYMYKNFKLMAQYAAMLSMPDDAKSYHQKADELAKNINTILYNEYSKYYGNNSLTSNILPLIFGFAPEQDKKMIFQNLVTKQQGFYNNHVGTGLIGAQWQMKTYTQMGRPDIAYALATNRDYPSWGYMADKGATTIWELWNGDKADPAMNSGNHVMLLGDLLTWMYEDLGGIAPVWSVPGFKKLYMYPQLVQGLDYVNAGYQSVHGKIVSNWKKEGNKLNWKVNIPANTSAIVCIPAATKEGVSESGTAIAAAKDIKILSFDNNILTLEAGSGEYSFVSALPPAKTIPNYVQLPDLQLKDTIVNNKYSKKIVMTSLTKDAKIYYTTDGTDPTAKSYLYDAPITVNRNTLLKTKAIKDGMPESVTVSQYVDVHDPAKNGWTFKYYEGEYKKLPDFAASTPIYSGTSITPDIEKIKKREDNFAIKFTASLIIDMPGEYTFFLSSDDGSRLAINGKKLIEIDGIHGIETGMTKVTLNAGTHKVELEYFEAAYGQYLDIEYMYNGKNKMKIPASKLLK